MTAIGQPASALIKALALRGRPHKTLSPPVAVAADQRELGFYSCSGPLKSDGDPVLEHLRPAVSRCSLKRMSRTALAAFWSGAFI